MIGRSHNVGLPIALLLAADMARGLLIDSIYKNYKFMNFWPQISSQMGKVSEGFILLRPNFLAETLCLFTR